MILGVISDTHGNRKLMHQVAERMEQRLGVEVFIHLGDNYADAEELALAYPRVIMVPGLSCPEYGDPRIPKRLVQEFDGIAIACAHADKDLRHTEYAAAIILTGHTHVARIDLIGCSLYVNPGHLRSPQDRGEKASFAIIETGQDEVRAAIHDYTGDLRRAVTVERARLA
ncbi:MAG: metallophosphoesterase family protein [Candidatus Hydrogenedentes bacterium]|nr:metallophosphoesterase family protein [Candidatus Hydrogenedentota bacterium]